LVTIYQKETITRRIIGSRMLLPAPIATNCMTNFSELTALWN
jgi:hypothetical protein